LFAFTTESQIGGIAVKTQLLLLETLVLRNVAFELLAMGESHPSEINGLDPLISELERAIRASSAKTVTEGDIWYCVYYEDRLPVEVDLGVSLVSLARRLSEAASRRGEEIRRELFATVATKFKASLTSV